MQLLLTLPPPHLTKKTSDLPFELVAPAYVTASWLGGNDSPTTSKITYSLSNEMTSFFSQLEDANLNDTTEELFAPYDYDTIGMTTQVDWAVDDVNDPVSGWHCNQYWDFHDGVAGYDDEWNYRVGEWDGVDMWIGNCTETVNDHWVTRYVSEEAYYGNPDTHTTGLKDQLNPSQYEWVEDEYGDYDLWIDYTMHTVYFRMRFVVFTWSDSAGEWTYYYSDWSNTAAVGKDAETFEALTEDDLPKPAISNLHMTDDEFNGHPVAAYTLTVPDSLAENNTKLTVLGGDITIQTFGRIKGDTEWIELDGDWIMTAGEMKIKLQNLSKDGKPIPKNSGIEIRCRYVCYQPWLDVYTIYSEYSDTLSLETVQTVYHITFKDYDGRVIGVREYYEGAEINEPGPERADDANYRYTFAGWSPTPVPVAGDTTYTATYSTRPLVFTVKFEDWDGTVLKSEELAKGVTPTPPANPSRAGDGVYTYVFAGWDPQISPVNDDCIYTAVYTSTQHIFTVKFVDWDGTVLSEKTYSKGETVTVPADPSRKEDDDYVYTFEGWSPEVTAVTADVTYSAEYSSKKKEKDYIPGDVNGNGKIDTADYAMAKRAFLKTFTLNEDQLKRADINKNGKLDASEYAMIKRHYLKTYVIPGAEGK